MFTKEDFVEKRLSMWNTRNMCMCGRYHMFLQDIDQKLTMKERAEAVLACQNKLIESIDHIRKVYDWLDFFLERSANANKRDTSDVLANIISHDPSVGPTTSGQVIAAMLMLGYDIDYLSNRTDMAFNITKRSVSKAANAIYEKVGILK